MDKLADITAQGWILAYFIRSDGERFLLGTGAYDFKSDLQHFQPNTMANDIVELQGTDGQLIAGQVRRSATQSFNGYVGDSTQNRERIEELRRDFLMFFRKNFFYKTVYIYPNGTAIQRKRGYLVDAPSVPELYQFFPEYHVALNYEDPNYYEYAEDAHGDEIFANILAITLTTPSAGGLVWDTIGAVSHGYVWSNPQTASGSAFQLTGIEGAPLTLTEITGNVEQNGTPTPDAPVAVQTTTGEQVVKITGKNLINENGERSSQYIDGNGNFATGVTNGYVNQQIPTQPNTTYTFSASAKSAQQVYIRIGEYRANGSFIRRSLISSLEQTITTDAECYIIKTCIDVSTGNHFTNPQFELGSTASAYEPYQGQDYPIDLSSKNLFDKNAVSTGKIIERTDGTLENNASYDTSDFMPVKAGEKYTYTGFNVWYASYYDANKTFVSTPNNSTTITIPSGVAYVRCSLLQTNLDTAQFEHGTQATSYADFYSYELAKIGNYQDRIYKQDGKWYIEKQITKQRVDNRGSIVLEENGVRYRNAPYDIPASAYPPLLSNYLQSASSYDEAVNTNGDSPNRIGFNASGILLCNIGGYTTTEEYINFFNNHEVYVYYALATPTTTEITDSTLLAQLNFIANLYGGTNNIMLVGTGAQGEIEVQYMTEVDTDGAGYEWEGGGGGGNTITLDAVEAVRPVWQVVGPATNPTLTNITTGETISFDGTVPAGQTLTVDMDARTATMAGANVFQFITGDWLRLEPGNNRISYTATGTTEPSTLSWNGVVG